MKIRLNRLEFMIYLSNAATTKLKPKEVVDMVSFLL